MPPPRRQPAPAPPSVSQTAAGQEVAPGAGGALVLPPAAFAAGGAAGAGVAGATAAGAVVTGLAGEAAIAYGTKKIVDALLSTFRRKIPLDVLYVITALERQYPGIPQGDIEQIRQAELERERQFQAKTVERWKTILPKLLAIPNPEKRAEAVRKFRERERQIMEARQHAMLERGQAAIERTYLRILSPQGAFWSLSPHVKQHTLDCLVMGGKFWPWLVLDAIHPPLHHGCPCMLFGLDEALQRGLMTMADIPKDEQAALRRARHDIAKARKLQEAVSPEQYGLWAAGRDGENLPAPDRAVDLVLSMFVTETALPIGRDLEEVTYADHLHPRDRVGRWVRKLGFPSYKVGGTVRDGLIGRQSKDEDFMVMAHPSQIRKAAENAGARVDDLKVRDRVVGVRVFPAKPDLKLEPGAHYVSPGEGYASVAVTGMKHMPQTIEHDGRTFTKVPNLHATVFTGDRLRPELVDKLGEKEADRRLAAVAEMTRDAGGLIEVRDPELRLATREERASLVLPVRIGGFNDFMGKASEKLGIPVPEPRGHVTLYTATGRGIGLTTPDDYAATAATGIRVDARDSPIPREGIEIAPPRVEVSTGQGRHDFEIVPHPAVDPDVETPKDADPLHDDAMRRDFTLNALYKDVASGDVLDPTGTGKEDLEAGLLRTTSPDSFREDPLRMLRATRFMSSHGFTLHPSTREQMTEHAGQLDVMTSGGVSGTAVTELNKTLMGPHVGDALRAMRDTGTLASFLPELRPAIGFDQDSKYHDLTLDEHIISVVENLAAMDAPLELRLAALFHDAGKPEAAFRGEDGRLRYYGDPATGKPEHAEAGAAIARAALERLGYDKATVDRVERIVRHHMVNTENKRPARVRRWRAGVGADLVDDLLMHRRADISAKGEGADPEHVAMLDRFSELARAASEAPSTRGDLAVTGRDVIAAGVPPGPLVGAVLDDLLDRVVSDPSLNHKEWLLAEVARQYPPEVPQIDDVMAEPTGYDTGVFFHVTPNAAAVKATGALVPRGEQATELPGGSQVRTSDGRTGVVRTVRHLKDGSTVMEVHFPDGSVDTYPTGDLWPAHQTRFPAAEGAVYLWPTREAAEAHIGYMQMRGAAPGSLSIVRAHADTSQLEPDPEPFYNLWRNAVADDHRGVHKANELGYRALDEAKHYPDPVFHPEGETLREWLRTIGAPWSATSPSDVTPPHLLADPWIEAKDALAGMPVALKRDVARIFAQEGQAVIARGPRPLVEALAEALHEPAYDQRVWRVDLHPRDRKGQFRDVLGTFLKRSVRGPSGNVLRARGGLTVRKNWSNAAVIYRGQEHEVDLRPEQPDGTYKDLTPDEAEAAIAKVVDAVTGTGGDSIQDTGEDSLLNPARFAAVYNGFEHNGLKLRVNYARRLADKDAAGEMDADVLDGEKIVGHVVRNFAHDRDEAYAYHNEFRIDPAYQDRGFGGALSAHVEQGYRAGDIRRIDLVTDEVGGYAWARAGYEAKPPVLDMLTGGRSNPVGTVVQGRMSGVYGAMTERREEWGLEAPASVPPELADRWPEFMTWMGATPTHSMVFGKNVQTGWAFETPPGRIADLARWGSERPTVVGGRQMWLGKWFLVGTQWEGSKRLD